MNGLFRNIAGVMTIAVSLVPLQSCKKKDETLKADLGDAGYQLTQEDWFRASRGNDVAALKQFSTAKFPADTRDAAGDSALHAAAAAGAQEAADYLLSQRLPVDLRGGVERTPLMAAVIADQTNMVRWLLAQGADPQAKDQEGFKPLMLAVREGSVASVGELAPYSREDLDPALLLAALVGRATAIDELTNYGASVYARMNDGRTPLMIAAENGHAESVALLLDIGSSRFTTDAEGRTAAEIAIASGHPELAALILRDPLPSELALETPVEIAESMDAYVDAAVAQSPAPAAGSEAPARFARQHTVSVPIAGQRLGTSDPPAAKPGEPASPPPLVMRHYQEKEVPVAVKSVKGDTATVVILSAAPREVQVRAGDKIPGSSLIVVRMRRRMEDSKVNLGSPAEISVMEVRDSSSGATREWIAGVPSKAHDPIALVEDAATGKRYTAAPGQRFTGPDGTEFLISDVRPNQLVIQEVTTGTVTTIPLRGPRG